MKKLQTAGVVMMIAAMAALIGVAVSRGSSVAEKVAVASTLLLLFGFIFTTIRNFFDDED